MEEKTITQVYAVSDNTEVNRKKTFIKQLLALISDRARTNFQV